MKAGLLIALVLWVPVVWAQSNASPQTPGLTPSGTMIWSPVPYDPTPGINDYPNHAVSMSLQMKEHPTLAARLQPLLPQGGELGKTCYAFEELYDCVSALHAAANLNIDFWQLSEKLNGSNWKRLSAAIHQLRPNVNARTEAKKAKAEARNDMRESKKK